MTPQANIPTGARPVQFYVNADPTGVLKFGGWDQWQAHIKAEMEVDGITVTDADGTTFTGYYFPETCNPRTWLSKDDKQPRG